jgi:hypothetical protein
LVDSVRHFEELIMKNESQEEIVCVAHATTPTQAHIWQNALEQEGISCEVVGDYLEAGMGGLQSMRAEIWVHRKDLEKAQAILEVEQTPGEEAEEEKEE